MQLLQDRIVESLTGAFEQEGLQGAVNPGRTAEGCTVRAFRPGSLEPLFAVHLTFNPGYVYALIARPGELHYSVPGDRVVGKCEYGTHGDLTRLVDAARSEARLHARRQDDRLDSAYRNAVECAGTVEIADALVQFLKDQPDAVREGAAAALESLVEPLPSP